MDGWVGASLLREMRKEKPNGASVCRVDVDSDFASPSTGSKVPAQAALSNNRGDAAAPLKLCPP
jgi:hypothetical protein